MIPRYYENLETYVEPGQVLVIYGPRRVGKTTLLDTYLATTPYRYRLENGENLSVREQLSQSYFDRILAFVAGYQLLVIDEAQHIPNIGAVLKIIVDQRPDIRVIVTGSSSFDLRQQVGEPLTGRKRTLVLYPLSQLELQASLTPYELRQNLESYLIHGSYPAIVSQSEPQAKTRKLKELSDSYLLKDVLAYDGIRGTDVIRDLVRLLALQVGNLVSRNELANKLGIDVKTVERYLDVLQKCFVIWRLDSLKHNRRNEIRKSSKYYFYDCGIRNSVIDAFQPLTLRGDIGALWENFILNERLKYRSYTEHYANSYFWRLYSGAEIDLVEEYDGQFHASEIKYNPRKHLSRPPKSWSEAYPDSTFACVTTENYLDFIVKAPYPPSGR